MDIDKVINAQYWSVCADAHRANALEFYDEKNWQFAMYNHLMYLCERELATEACKDLDAEEFFLGMYLQLPKKTK